MLNVHLTTTILPLDDGDGFPGFESGPPEAETSSTRAVDQDLQTDEDPGEDGLARALPLDLIFGRTDDTRHQLIAEPPHRSVPGIFLLYGAWPRRRLSRGYLSETGVRLDAHETLELLRYPFNRQGLSPTERRALYSFPKDRIEHIQGGGWSLGVLVDSQRVPLAEAPADGDELEDLTSGEAALLRPLHHFPWPSVAAVPAPTSAADGFAADIVGFVAAAACLKGIKLGLLQRRGTLP